MNALTINPDTKQLQEIDIEMKANTVYSFFNSILIDELSTLNQHLVYADANALEQKAKAFFLGEQLILGKAMIIGKSGMQESDVRISKEALQELISYEVNDFYSEALALLSQSEINLYRTFGIQQAEETLQLNAEWVLYTFNMADDRTKEYFINELRKSLDAGEETFEYLKKMAQLAINSVQ